MTNPTPQPATDQQRLPALCPYCGHGHSLAPGKPRPLQCEACKGRFEPLSRQATQNAMGPWQIRDPDNPFRPPCSYETIVRLAQRGRITPTTIVRGPTTRQFWSYARDTPRVAAVPGQCHACRQAIAAGEKRGGFSFSRAQSDWVKAFTRLTMSSARCRSGGIASEMTLSR